MDEWPSFRNRRDVGRLVFALILPWVLLGLAFAVLLLDREVYRAGHHSTFLEAFALVCFLGFGFPALISLAAFFFIGLFRLIWWREYRYSWYGWGSAMLVWLNLCALTSVAH